MSHAKAGLNSLFRKEWVAPVPLVALSRYLYYQFYDNSWTRKEIPELKYDKLNLSVIIRDTDITYWFSMLL